MFLERLLFGGLADEASSTWWWLLLLERLLDSLTEVTSPRWPYHLCRTALGPLGASGPPQLAVATYLQRLLGSWEEVASPSWPWPFFLTRLLSGLLEVACPSCPWPLIWKGFGREVANSNWPWPLSLGRLMSASPDCLRPLSRKLQAKCRLTVTIDCDAYFNCHA